MAKSKTNRKRRTPPTDPFVAALASTLEKINQHFADRAGDVKSILVVEDDEDARDILVSVLEHAGYVTVGVSNGKEALEKLKKILPSLIMLDLMMPEMDGWSVDRALKADPALREIPVVVTSAFANLASSRTGVGADAWFQKPIDLHALLKALPGLMTTPEIAQPG